MRSLRHSLDTSRGDRTGFCMAAHIRSRSSSGTRYHYTTGVFLAFLRIVLLADHDPTYGPDAIR